MSKPVADDPAITGKDVFALIIGIDKYENKTDLPTLEGAVNDANEFHKFLVDSRQECGLGATESNIVLLKDGKATRQGILDAFKTHLLNNHRIPDNGDAAMILFFAGHGTRVSAPGNLMSVDSKVEGICPVDERTSPGGKYVHTIPDYVLVHLLQRLSEKKGRNITVIFDSCHSAGMAAISAGHATPILTPSISPPISTATSSRRKVPIQARAWGIRPQRHMFGSPPAT
ncbi:caspase domain-containing protein [Mycena maculata]|uniref:Caspase domain-containing protein n=1 Tax=Mycena maculata TaxID=230809 RepID=A0AAD7NA83_9AGAR|nr:caspase domain-containing protein [Mycena maculata]